MKLKKHLYIFAFALLCFTQAKAVDIYVSPVGNDNQSGTKNHPLQTLCKAQLLARGYTGKTSVNVILADGIYYLEEPLVFKPEDSGTKSRPVNYYAAHHGKAVISGGKRLTVNWRPWKNGIYQAKIAANMKIDQLYINGRRQRMARFPNAVPGKNVYDFWELGETRNTGAESDPLNPARIATWSKPQGAYIHAIHNALWGDMHWLVKGKNEDGTLLMEGGWQNNRPSSMHRRYRMIENVFEELDSPGEWFYDVENGYLYYFPDSKINIETATVEVAVLKHILEFQGSKENPVKFVNLTGFVFRHTARTFMENKEPLLRSDWTVYRGGALLYNGATDCTVSDCEFDQLGGNSVFVNNYNRRLTIKGCYIHEGGANGIAFVGDPQTVRDPLFRYGDQNFKKISHTPGPLGDNYPDDCLVEDCLITSTGRDEKQTAPVHISMSHKITIRHCSIYDVPRAGINIGEGTFGGHIIEYCDLFNTVLETGDHGSFNSWGRDRFWTPDINATAKEVKKDTALPWLDMLDPNIIRYNRWRCDHGWDIDLDDGSSWYYIHNNVLLNGGLKLREGYKRVVTNNVIINNSLHPHVWYPESGDIFKHNIVFGAYLPAAMDRGIAKNGKWGQQIDYNLFATDQRDMKKFLVNGCDSNSLVGDPRFVNPPTGDYRVKKGSPALKIGFENFPMDNFGVISKKLRKKARVPVFPEIIKRHASIPGNVYEWLEGSIKNVETPGEQSAYGLPSISGVLIVDAPEGSKLARLGFAKSDVIVACENQAIATIEQFLTATGAKNNNKKGLTIKVIRNQREYKIYIEPIISK